MILGIEDKDKKTQAFSVESIVAVGPDEDPEYTLLYLAHINGMPLRFHFTVPEFMQQIGAALEQIQGRAALLGMAKGQGIARPQ